MTSRLNIKRVQDLEKAKSLSEVDQRNSYIEVTRYQMGGTYHSYKISVSNFLRSLRAKLSDVSLPDKKAYADTNMKLGTLFFSAIDYPDKNFVVANGAMYTDNKFQKFYDVSYSENLTKFIDFLQANASSGSVVQTSISKFKAEAGKQENAGKYICDLESRIIRVPSLDTLYIATAGSGSDVGNRVKPNMPNITGMMKSCYHGFVSLDDEQYKVIIDQVKAFTGGAFDVTSSSIDKNYINADLDLSNQSEKYDWTTDISQLLAFSASSVSRVFKSGTGKVDPAAVKFVPYIVISDRFEADRVGTTQRDDGAQP